MLLIFDIQLSQDILITDNLPGRVYKSILVNDWLFLDLDPKKCYDINSRSQ